MDKLYSLDKDSKLQKSNALHCTNQSISLEVTRINNMSSADVHVSEPFYKNLSLEVVLCSYLCGIVWVC